MFIYVREKRFVHKPLLQSGSKWHFCACIFEVVMFKIDMTLNDAFAVSYYNDGVSDDNNHLFGLSIVKDLPRSG